MRERAGSNGGSRWGWLATAAVATTAMVCVLAAPAFAADNRAAAENIPLGGSVASSNFGDTEETGEPFNSSPFSPCGAAFDYGTTEWYQFTIPAAGTAMIRTSDDFEVDENANYGATGEPGFDDGFFNAVTAIFPSGSNSLLACALITANPGPDSSTISNHLGAGTYFIQVSGIWRQFDDRPEEGAFHLFVDYTQDPPPASPGSVNGKAGAQWKVFTSGHKARKTQNKSLTLRGVPGSTATISCNKCKPKTATFTIGGSGQLNLHVNGLLPPGTKIEIRISKPGFTGYLARYTTRARKLPKFVDCETSVTGAAAC